MAATVVQDILGGAQTTTATTAGWVLPNTTVTVASGSWIIGMTGMAASAARTLTSVSGGGLTWFVDITTSNTRSATIFSAYCPAGLASATAITLTWSGTTTNGKWASLWEVSGLVATTAIDKTGSNSAGAATALTVSTGTATASQNVAAFACFTQVSTSATGTPQASPAYTERADVQFGTGAIRLGYGETRIFTGGSIETATATSTVSGAYDAAIVTYLEAAASTATPRKPVFFASRARQTHHPQAARGRSAWR